MKTRSNYLFQLGLLALLLSACGGGGGSAPLVATTPPTTSDPTTPTTPTTPVVPVLSAQPLTLALHATLGTQFWPDGPTSSGGRGSAIDGVNCVSSEVYHIHAHLAIIRDGQMLGIPPGIGLQGCTYEMHSHDQSGVIHIETDTAKPFALHQFFSLWGQPLSTSNIAGITGLPVTVYIHDGNGLVQYTGALGDIELTAHREITIILGTVPAEIPSYTWVDL